LFYLAIIIRRNLTRFFWKVKEIFSDWIKKRIKQCRFVKNQDYWSLSQISDKPQGGRPTIEYKLTINAAEHIALMEGNEAGFILRQYYIDHRKHSQNLIKQLIKRLDKANKLLFKDFNTANRQALAWVNSLRICRRHKTNMQSTTVSIAKCKRFLT